MLPFLSVVFIVLTEGTIRESANNDRAETAKEGRHLLS